MTANLSQAFLESSGLLPSLIQELTAGNFHEGRESFHNYIYSRFILGDDKSNSASGANSGATLLPNTSLPSDFSEPLQDLGQDSEINAHTVDESGGGGGGSNEGAALVDSPSLTRHIVPQKFDSSRKKSPQVQHGILPQVNSDDAIGETKVKKKNLYKKKEKTNVCDVCGRGFAEKYTLNRHMLTHTRIKPYSCSKCNMSFSRSDGLSKHMAAGHRRVDAHHCDVCGGTFNSELSFEQHRREYGNTLPFVCNLCMLAFSQCCHLNYHMKSHALSKMNDGFGYDVQDEKNLAIDESELIPDDCSPPKKDQHKFHHFTFMNSLKSRIADAEAGNHSFDMLDPNIVIKSESEEFTTCSSISNQISGNGATQRSTVKASFDALSFPSNTSAVATTQGAMNFAPNQALTNLTTCISESTHSNGPGAKDLNLPGSQMEEIPESEMNKYYNIKIPNPKFQEGADLGGGTIGADGLFRCGLCGKGFTRKYHMQRHVKLHTRGPVPRAHLLDWTRRPYACGVCKMGFTRQHHLTRHILIHTGERPHPCHVCGKAFRRFTNLSLHIRTVHGAERPFKCQICGRGFPRLYSLQRHLKLHAKNAALASKTNDQQYKDLEPANAFNFENRQSSAYLSANQNNIQQSPGNSQESLPSNHSHDGATYEREQANSLQHNEQNESGSIMTNQEKYTLLQERSHDAAFQSLSSQTGQNMEHTNSYHPNTRQSEEGLIPPQVLLPPECDRPQQNRLVSPHNENIKLQNPALTRVASDFSSMTHYAESLRNHLSLQTPNDFNSQQSVQMRGDLSHSMRMVSASVGGNFDESDTRESSNYTQNTRGGNGDEYVIHQQRMQSPLPMMSTFERPGSRCLVIQPGSTDSFRHPSGYSQSLPPLPIQQRSAVNLPAPCTTASSTNMQDHRSYPHNGFVDIGVNQNSINEPAVYSHSHSMNSMPFQGSGGHVSYQQQLTESLQQLDMHPHPSPSPLPVNSSSSMQY